MPVVNIHDLILVQLLNCAAGRAQLKLADQILAEDKHQPLYKVGYVGFIYVIIATKSLVILVCSWLVVLRSVL
jgi:hypothetical protein